MLYFIKFHGVKHPMKSKFTLQKGEYVLTCIDNEKYVGQGGDRIHFEVEPKGRILRPVYNNETDRIRRIRGDEETAFRFCRKRIEKLGLEMKLVGVDKEWDGKRYKFYYLADKRVDFRQLVKDLKEEYNTVIELRHIGVRDYAGYTGGIGLCGRPLCCKTFLIDKPRVRLEAARDQDIYISPSKISGPCGRLLCCITYEHEYYQKTGEKFPERGDTLKTSKGQSMVLHRNMISKVVTISYEDETQEVVPIEEIEKKGDKWVKISKSEEK